MKCLHFSVAFCLLFIPPCTYIWLSHLPTVGDALYDQYKFGCLAVALSCVIEQIAEVPTFITQVNCKIRVRVVMDCIHLTVRSVVFIYLVRAAPELAIRAFGVAQLTSAVVFTLGFYGYYYHNIATNVKETKTIALTKFQDMFPSWSQQVEFLLIHSCSVILKGSDIHFAGTNFWRRRKDSSDGVL